MCETGQFQTPKSEGDQIVENCYPAITTHGEFSVDTTFLPEKLFIFHALPPVGFSEVFVTAGELFSQYGVVTGDYWAVNVAGHELPYSLVYVQPADDIVDDVVVVKLPAIGYSGAAREVIISRPYALG